MKGPKKKLKIKKAAKSNKVKVAPNVRKKARQTIDGDGVKRFLCVDNNVYQIPWRYVESVMVAKCTRSGMG